MSFDLNHWYNEKLDKDVIFNYKGSVGNEDVTEILNSVEQILKDRKESPRIFKKIFNVFVELAQNLYHHSEVPSDFSEDYDRFGILIFRDEGTQYRICAGNFLKTSGLKLIRDRIDQVNNLSSEETQNLYRTILNNEKFTEKGGGGLGIVDIARKSDNRVEYHFFEYNPCYLFLAIDVII